ncbi:MAG: glycogen debranching N-terminal domain-containing protein [Kineosporiaceae bacterium]
MTAQWTFGGEPPALAHTGVVTLVEGSTFCIGASNGDLVPPAVHGLFFRDTRILSRWQVRVDGHELEGLKVDQPDPFSAVYLSRTPPRPGRADSTLLVVRRRYIGDGMREDLTLENLAAEAVGCTVTVLVESDFADLFEVKENRVHPLAGRVGITATDSFQAEYRWMGHSRGVRVSADPVPAYQPGVLTFHVVVPARGRWEACLQVQASVDDVPVPGRHLCGQPTGSSSPEQALSAWRRHAPRFDGHAGLTATLRRSQEDLGVLRIFDREHPERAAVAAGAPWFMSLFGRDSLLSAWMALPVDRGLAIGTLQTLGGLQGKVDNPLTEEQPGRIMHERRAGLATELMLGGGDVYYGSADATPLFVMLLEQAWRWGARTEEVTALLPFADRALDWVIGDGDRDGDGFVEYRRATDRGLANQGWKDSWDGINFAGGRIAEPPIALCEVQGYAYAAFRARAALAADFGDEQGAHRWSERARSLKAAFHEAFWLPEQGYYAIALDGDKQPVDALASNMGHCLWTGIVDDEHAAQVVEHLLSPAMFTGWGVRTLASTMGAYNPMSYHNGSVWPHDTAIVLAGMVRYGFLEQAQQVATGLMDAAEAFGGRLPELFCGFDRSEFSGPVPYPTSCSPQAWAAATPLLLLRSLLQLEPDVPAGRITIAPQLPPGMLPITIEQLSVADGQLSLTVDATGRCSVTRSPDHLIVQLAGTAPPQPDPTPSSR